MPVSIPTTRQPALTREPRNLFIYGRTKVGKSTICSVLPDALHLDLEQGTGFIETRRVVIETADQLVEAVDALPAAHAAAPFRWLIVDTIDVIDEWADEVATSYYKRLPMGKTFAGATVRELDRGAGFYYIREAFKRFLRQLMSNALWKTVFIGHVRDKYADGTSKLGTQVNEVDIDLAGKAKSIMCSKMDAIGYAFRDPTGRLMLSFDTRDQVNCGNRSPYLAGKTFAFPTPPSIEAWKAIYPDTLAVAAPPALTAPLSVNTKP